MRPSQTLQIRVELLGTQPTIWRRLRLDGGCSFWDLHSAIQDAMGWQDSHMHRFRVQDPKTGSQRFFGLPLADEADSEPGWEVGVAEVLLVVGGPAAVYEYDFGDGWEHAVVLEEVLPAPRGARTPACLGGARACPPEEVGGVPGYAAFLAAIADPRHEAHDDLLEWVGGSFDPDSFDPKAVRFQDPDERRRQVFGEAVAAGVSLVGGPQPEGGFTAEEVALLIHSPFAAASPLQLHTALADDEVEEAAPLVCDLRRFLRVLADAEPLKLTPAGNLPRAALARLIEAGALGSGWEGPPRGEQDAPWATVLRGVAEQAGLVRKQLGRLHLTRRGGQVADGRLGAGQLYGMVIGPYATVFNWAFADPMPASRWLQAGFWYALYLLQAYGRRWRPVTFYADKMARAFPVAMEDFSRVGLVAPEQMFAWAFERRVLGVFAAQLGLARLERSPGKQGANPSRVQAGPLLSRVVTWRRGDAVGGRRRPA